MDPQYLAALEETLQQTFAPATVKQATAKLSKDFYSNPWALPSLLHILQTTQLDQLKQLAAVEARKLVGTKWETVDASLKPEIRKSLLQNTFTQSSPLIRHSSARVVAAIGEYDLQDDSWNDLLPTLVNAVNELNAQTKEMAVYTLYTLLETRALGLIPHQDDFVTMFTTLLLDQTSQDIRVNAVLSLDVLSQFIEEDEEINAATAAKFKASIPGMVQVLKEVIQIDDADKVKDIFNVLNSLIYLDNMLVGDQIVHLVQFVSELAVNTQLDDEYRCMALQFLISVVSLRKSKISTNNLGPHLTAIATAIASEEVDVEDELNNEDEENENEENTPSTLALRLLGTLSGELPPSQVIVPFFENLNSMVSSQNAFSRRAALLCIGIAAGGAPDFFAAQINKIMPVLTSGLQDNELIVKVAATRAVSSLSSEIQDAIASFHEQLLPLVIEIINSASHVMTYKYACYALDGIIEFMSHDAIAQYVEPLTNKLFAMLEQAHSSSLKVAIVSAIGSTAFAGGKGFTPYFEQSIRVLEPFVANAAQIEGMSEDDIELRAVTFENISTMARAVGSQSFSAYAKPLVEAAYASLSSEHSRIRESGFAFISNMAKVYGSEFAGFLEEIVPQILKCLEQEEFSFNSPEEEEDFEDDDDEENIGNDFKINTGITIEKEIASIALAELATGTGAAFAKYVEPSIKVLSEQIETSYGMREAAMNCIWKIVRAMFKATYGDKYEAPRGVPQQPYVDASLLVLIEEVRNITVNNLEEEFELSLVACDLDNIVEGLHTFGAAAIITSAADTTSLEKLCVQLLSILKKEHSCQIDDEEPVDDGEDASETEALLFESALEVLIMLSLTLGPDFVKVFDSFKDVILSNITSKSKNKRSSAIGGLAEICVGLKEANPYTQELLQVFVDRLANDKSVEVKGNAAYGVGIIIESSTNDFSASYQHILQMMFHLLSKSDEQAKVDDDETKDVVSRSNANACGCVARMALKNGAGIPLEHVLPALLNRLPLEAAPEENVPILTWIITLYESGNEVINLQSERVIQVLAEIFQKEADRIKLVEESTLGREENIEKMKQFKTEALKEKVVNLLKFLNGKYGSIIASHDILKAALA